MKLPLLSLTVIAATALAAGRFVGQDGNYPAAGGKAFGVTDCDAAAGDPTPVAVIGVTDAIAGAAIGKDVPVMATATGKVIAHDGAVGSIALGKTLAAAAGDGSVVEILLVPNVGAADAD